MDYHQFRTHFFQLVEGSENIVITSHISPDDDSIASVLSVYTILTQKYPQKNIRIIYTGTPITRYRIFPHFEKIEFVDDIAHHVTTTDLLIGLDANQYFRFSTHPDIFKNISKTILIDHHGSPADSATLSLVVPTTTSNAENIYHALIEGEEMSKDVASYILLGILGDTGNFSYVAPSQSHVFIVAQLLLEKVGMSIDSFRSRYSAIPKRIIPLLQELVKNTTYTTLSNWPPLQYSFIDRAVVQQGKYEDEDISAASHIYMGQYLPRVEGYHWGFVITPRTDGSARMSSRSLSGSVNVRIMHEKLGVGSGHDRASGGVFKKESTDRDPEHCIAQILEWMKNNEPVIG